MKRLNLQPFSMGARPSRLFSVPASARQMNLLPPNSKLDKAREKKMQTALHAADLARRFKPFPLPQAKALSLAFLNTEVDRYLHQIAESHDPATAFDMEWNISKQKGSERRTGLIQIAHDQAGLLLYSVPRGESQGLPESLMRYLASPSTIKVGVNISADIKKLARDFGGSVQANGLIELSVLARTVDRNRWLDNASALISLQNLTAAYLERYLHKGDERRSNFEGFNVSSSSLQYAAGDVLSSLAIYRKLMMMRDTLQMDLNPQLVVDNVTADKTSLTKRQEQAWNLCFRDDVSSLDLDGVAKQMKIKPDSVLGHILAGIERNSAQLGYLSDTQAQALQAALAGRKGVAISKHPDARSQVEGRASKI